MNIAPLPVVGASRRKLRLPFADMHAAVHVQHFSGYMASFRQINHRIRDILRLRNRAHRRKGHQEVFRDPFDKRGVDSPGRNLVEADVVLRILARKAQGVTVIPARPW